MATTSFTGCLQDDGIEQYTVDKIAPRKKPATPVVKSATGQAAWFFKMTGPADETLKQIVPFSQLVKSLSLDAQGTPGYELPKGWTATNGPPPRHQTIQIAETDPPLEVSVSSLPGPSSAFDEYLLANVNRWRGQLKMPPYASGDEWLEQARDSGELMVVPTGGRILAIINLIGETSEHGATRMLAAVVLSPPAGAATTSTPKTPPSTVKPPLDFKLPEGWTATAGNAMRLASFEAPHDSGVADISVSRFPGGGDVVSNVNRWRGQVKLEPLSDEALKESLKEIEVGGKPASYIEANGDEQSILAAIVPDGDAKWFFKMQGPREAVSAETSHFQEFLKSVTFQE